jgi:hypothetical protein
MATGGRMNPVIVNLMFIGQAIAGIAIVVSGIVLAIKDTDKTKEFVAIILICAGFISFSTIALFFTNWLISQ